MPMVSAICSALAMPHIGILIASHPAVRVARGIVFLGEGQKGIAFHTACDLTCISHIAL